MLQNVKNFRAAAGYDVVSYFSGTPLKGKESIATTFNGAEYLFVIEENKKTFLQNPEKYVPLYGGFCAIAMSEGSTVPVHPLAYLIQNDRLLLFYAIRVFGIFVDDTRRQWAKDPERFFVLAGEVYQKLNSAV